MSEPKAKLVENRGGGMNIEQKRWIRFVKLDSTTITSRWDVQSKDGGTIGGVAWYPYWRRYCFFPQSYTVYEQQCLRDIAEFIERKTREHKERRKEKE